MKKEQALEKKKIKRDIKACIDKGKPKQQILEELSMKYKDKATVSRQLEIIPSRTMKDKYRLFNYMLAALLLVVTILDIIILSKLNWGKYPILDINFALSIVLDAIFLVGVLLYRNEIYSWVASRAVVSLIIILTMISGQLFPDINVLIFVSLSLVILFLVLSLFLGIRLCPPRVPKVVEVDVNGIAKINKTIYVFPD